MKAWSYWFPDLMLHVAGCPSILATHELRRAAQAFFDGTRSWKVIEDALPVAADQTTVTTTPSDSEQEVVRVEGVVYDGQELTLEPLESMASKYGPDWRSHTAARPSAYLQITPGEITLYPVPTDAATDGVVRTLSVRPSDTSPGLPDDIAQKYRDEIHLGARARLMLIPNKPWTNLELGSAYGQAFDKMTGKANLVAALSFGRGRIASRPTWC